MKRLCPICNSDNAEVLYHQKFNNSEVSLIKEYDVVVCQHCLFVFADDIPTQNDFNEYYGKVSRYEFDHNSGNVSESYIAHNNGLLDYLEKRLSLIKTWNDGKKRILEIGCSTGYLLKLLKDRGYNNILGVDPSLSCVKTVRTKYKIKAIRGNLTNLGVKEKVDLVILSAVIEHVVNLDEAMKNVKSLMRDDGLVFIEVPNADKFNLYAYTPFQQFSFEHIDYFTKASLTNLLGKHGLKIVDITESENRGNQTIDPNLLVVAQKSVNVCPPYSSTSEELENIRKYIELCQRIDLETKEGLSQLLSDVEKVIVWGVGTNTQRLINNGIPLSKVLYFVDSNKHYSGKVIQGIEIKSPQGIQENVPILVMSHSYHDEIVKQIKNVLRLENKIISLYSKKEEVK